METIIHTPTAADSVAPPVDGITATIGSTPLVQLHRLAAGRDIELFAKMESFNPGGSAKDRPAAAMLQDAIRRGLAGPGTTVIESSSGNMGVALAQLCRYHDMQFVCVVDARAHPVNIRTMRALGATVHVVTDPDPATGDLLVARLALVDHLVRSTPGAFRPDQYANPANPAAHAAGTMREIDDALHGDVDVVFVATSTTGTLAGCCALLRDRSRATSVVAVDAVGSVLFGGARGPRLLPGFGAGIETPLSRAAGVHDVVRVSDIDCVVGCRRLVAREAVFAGASSGGVVTAFERTIDELPTGSRCVLIFHDGGAGYLETVYDDAWVQRELAVDPVQLERMVTRANRAC